MLTLQPDVLVVDDDAATREALAELITAWGASVRTVGSAREARAAYAERRPDVLISDIQMPDEDGCSLIVDLRGIDAAFGDERLYAIACTGRITREDRERQLACGFDSVLAKPIDLHALRRALDQGAGMDGRWPVDTEGSPARDS